MTSNTLIAIIYVMFLLMISMIIFSVMLAKRIVKQQKSIVKINNSLIVTARLRKQEIEALDNKISQRLGENNGNN